MILLSQFIATCTFFIISDQFMNSHGREIINRNMDSEKLVLDIFKVAKIIPARKKNLDYDYFVLSLMWPQTNCYFYHSQENKKFNSDLWQQEFQKGCSECNMPFDNHKWTIHGLWPSNDRLISRKDKKKKIHDCGSKKNEAYQTNMDVHLVGHLETNWMSFDPKFQNHEFRLHEWRKHGTCVKDREDMKNQKNFYQKTIQIYHDYDPSELLTRNEIVPGGSYNVANILAVLRTHLGNARPILICVKEGGEQHLQEIRICLNRELNEAKNCEIPKEMKNECDPTYDVLYDMYKRPCSGKRLID